MRGDQAVSATVQRLRRRWGLAAGLAAGLALIAVGAVGITALAGGSDVVLDALLQRPHAENGVVVVPDRLLRSWDPVTVFFPTDAGPANPGPVDPPRSVARLDPDHPGGWQWLDRRTLQFRPAEPWPPLDGVTVRVGVKTVVLSTVSSPPTSTVPVNGAAGLGPVETVSLVFSEPIRPEVLARMTTIEVRPLPGIGPGPTTRLGRDAFEVKVLDRASANDPAQYTLVLREPIPLGQRVVVRLALSQDLAADEAVSEIVFSTAEPFRPVAFGCDGHTLPVSPGGTKHPGERPLRCTGQRAVRVSFTSALGTVTPLAGRNLVRFEPAVDDLVFEPSGTDLIVRGSFLPDVPYRVALAPVTGFVDGGGRELDITGESAVWVYFPPRPAYLRWGAAQGVAEQYGPKRIPVEGRGIGSADLRVYRIDPLNRSFWPFADRPIEVDESQRPPGPGEQPPAWDKTQPLTASDLRARIAAIGSPAYSAIVDVPAGPESELGARFGLDVSDALEAVSGKNAPGHYLVGLRRLDGGTQRAWVRLQVTDLALTTVENPTSVLFQVSSLRSGAGVGGAAVRIEGERRATDGTVSWATLFDGVTGGDGTLPWAVPGGDRVMVRRIVVRKGEDVLVLDPNRPPDAFASGSWQQSGETWLQWAFQNTSGRVEQARTLAHLFPDRPVYRPGDEVHLKGYLRSRKAGHLTALTGAGHVVVQGPGDAEWRLPVELSAEGSFHASWKEAEPPTGAYWAEFEAANGARYGRTTFQVEAYRLPTFEVVLSAGAEGADQVPNDVPFDVRAAAAYYAGGRVAARPIRWRVTQYPYAWAPAGADGFAGFAWSTDDRYGRGAPFRATPELGMEATTGADGEATLSLDPGIEADARPRTYTVEATVTGADEQTVTSTLRVDAVPAFVVGLKAPRYLPDATTIPVEVLALGFDGAPVAGKDLTVRLIHRQWHSVLQATDFTAGEPKYLTDVVDVPISDQTVTSGGAPTKVPLKVPTGGVYLVEVEARDAIGRVQVVRLDLYAGGSGAVAWEKPKAGTFDLTLDAPAYRPGQTANVVVRSPFQDGDALVVIEGPERNVYKQVAVRQGKAVIGVPIDTGWVPKVPVHVVLRRGRGTEAQPGSSAGSLDLGKPQTVASTVWLPIEPVENEVKVAVTLPERALPGATVPVTVKLADPGGKALAGEVTLWLVDQAVLALGKEQRLDPLPDFITDRQSRVAVRDTRNQVLGTVPTEVMPGGDGGDMAEERGVLDNATIRKDFRPLAYYEPSLKVGPSGTVTVNVKLPDNLTVFKVRAKAISGSERFGFATGQIAVRLPVLVQPALPRFVRPGDAFDATALARVVEGPGGAATGEISARGLTVTGDTKRAFTLDATVATPLGWPVSVGTPPLGEDGQLAYDDVTIKVGTRRTSDGATDAFEATLPLRDDRRPRFTRQVFELAPGGSAEVAALPEAARPGSVRRTVVVGTHPALIRMASALDVMRDHTPTGTDAILSRARVAVGLGALRGPLGLEDDGEVRAILDATWVWLPGVLDENGLVAPYPGSRGRVWLTADALRLIADAEAAGYPVDQRIRRALESALTASLRSDYRYFLDGESWMERTSALYGLSVDGKFDPAYFAELSRNAKFLVPEAQATVLLAAARGNAGGTDAALQLADRVKGEIEVELYQGKERYAGLASARTDRTPFIAPSEAREVATILHGLGAVRPNEPALSLLVDALVRLGAEDGWGQSNADAAALLALSAELSKRTGPAGAVAVTEGGKTSQVAATKDAPIGRGTSTGSGAISLKNTGTAPVVVLVSSRWVPSAPGSAQAPEQSGFVVEREWILPPAAGAPAGTPAEKRPVAAGGKLVVSLGQVVEEHVRVVNPSDRFDVIVTVPLAAGMEPLNPALATSGPEARAANPSTATPTWTSLGDDRALYAFERLAKGTYDLYFRTRATTAGAYVMPAASAEMVYDRKVIGSSAGSAVEVRPK